MNDRNERILTKLSVFFHGFVRVLSGSGSKIGTTGCREIGRVKARAEIRSGNLDIQQGTAVLFMESEELSPP